MNNDEGCSKRPESHRYRRSAELRELTDKIFHVANAGLLKRDFIPEVSLVVLEYVRCDELELRVREDDHIHYLCRADRSGSVQVELDSLIHSAETSRDIEGRGDRGQGLDGFCRRVMLDRSDRDLTDFHWPGASDSAGEEGRTVDEERGIRSIALRTEGSFRSLALIPIFTEGRYAGLLKLRSRERDFFPEASSIVTMTSPRPWA